MTIDQRPMTHFLEYAIGHWSIFTCDLGRTLYSMIMLAFIVRRRLLWIVGTLIFGLPSWRHPLGNDELGRDILSRILLGTRVSMRVGATVVLLSGIAGVFDWGICRLYLLIS